MPNDQPSSVSGTGPVLVVLAAGVGRRFGGLKQLAPVGPGGEAILDYSGRDALVAGFSRIVLVVRSEIEPAIRDHLRRAWPARVPVSLARQEADPRTGEPRGTADALLAASGEVGGDPVAVINADDYYGPGTFAALSGHLAGTGDDHALVGFRLIDTVPSGGPAVRRALCGMSSDGYLTGIAEAEVRAAEPAGDGNFLASGLQAGDRATSVSGEQLVSMNAWGFRSSVWPPLRELVDRFPSEPSDAGRAEVLLPDAVGLLMAQGGKVRILRAVDRWCGLTWAQDLATVQSTLAALRSGDGGGEGLEWPL